MKKYLKQVQQYDGVMETDTIQKNGASLKSLMSKGNIIFILFVFIASVCYAQSDKERTFTVQTFVAGNYVYQTIDGLDPYWPISCLDSSAPFNVTVMCQSKTAETRTIKVSLYVPKKAFMESIGTDRLFDNYNFIYKDGVQQLPTLNDLEKIKEFTIKVTTTLGEDHREYGAEINIPWDAMTDPAFTNGKSSPVQGSVFTLAEDTQTSEVLNANNLYHPDNNLYPDNNPLRNYSRVSRYSGKYDFTYTAKQNSVVCDLYFISSRPVKKAVPFLAYSCALGILSSSALKESLEAVVQSLHQDIYAYQVFDNLSPDEDGVYHLSWELKDLQGKFFDSEKYYKPYFVMGLFVEGDRQETFSMGLPEYGGATHGQHGSDYMPSYLGNEQVPPRPLNPNELVNYPEFDIVNGVLLHYHGNGGDVVIPNSVTKINDLAFYQCNSLTKVTIPEGVTSIGNSAFYECTNMTSVIIPNTVTSIGASAFQNCAQLQSITVPNTVTAIGTRAFQSCAKLQSITLPEGITAIKENTFYGCRSLSSVSIPGNVKSIGKEAFMYCPLESLTLPNGVAHIEENAFYGCAFQSVTIPASVTGIGEAAFWNQNLKSITVESGNSSYITEDGILFDRAKTILLLCPAGLNKTACIVPNTVQKIGNCAFAYCNNLSSITLPNTLKRIGEYALGFCTSLTSIILPDGLENIGEYAFVVSGLSTVTIPGGNIGIGAFTACNNLSSVVISSKVTHIGYWSFSSCPKLSTIEVRWKKPLEIRGDGLIPHTDEYEKVKLIVPKGTKALYQADPEWGKFSTIEESDYSGIKPMTAAASIYISGSRLVVNSPVAETVSVYSITGSLLYSITKPAGEKNMDIEPVRDKIWIVKGSSGWVRKMIR